MTSNQENLLKVESAEVAIICGEKASWREAYAAEELKRYLGQMSGVEVAILSDSSSGVKAGEHLFLIGENRITQGLLNSKQFQSTEQVSSDDGFVIKSAQGEERHSLVLCGKTDIGTLYAVYNYLVAFCGVGFFRDGEQVPRRKEIPFYDISVTEEPRFADRSAVTMHGGLGLKKYESGLWSREEWRSFYDWMAKARCNMTNSILGPWDWGAEAAYRACEQIGKPIGKEQQEEPIGHMNDWPQSWTRRMEYQSETVREIQDYGRKRGIRFPYSFGYGDVPFEFLTAYPESRQLATAESQLAYNIPRLHPDDSLAYEFVVAYLKNLVEMFGTDHIYQCCPYVEESPGATPQESIELKIKASQQIIRAIREIDPDGIWRSDSWDFIANLEEGTLSSRHWNAKTIKNYFDHLSEGLPYIYDVTCGRRDEDLNWVVSEAYKVADYFHGRPWGFGMYWCFQGAVHLHGDIDLIIERTKDVAKDPRAVNCRGFYDIAESQGHNIFYEWVLLKLAWNPLVTREELIQEYALTRYGEAAWNNMRESVTLMAKAMKITHGEIIYYMIPFWRNVLWDYEGISKGDPVEQRFEIQYKKSRSLWLERHKEAASLFAASLGHALKEKAGQKANVLYENDIVDLGKAVIHELSNAHLILTYQAFKAGDAETLIREKKIVLALLSEQKKILSTRGDFSVEAMIEEVMARPAMNKQVPRMVKEWQIVSDYSAHDSVERLHYLDIPRIERYLSLLEEKLSRGDRHVRLSDYLPGGRLPSGGNESTWTDIERRWVMAPVHVERTFEGTPIEAVEDAIRGIKDVGAWAF